MQTRWFLAAILSVLLAACGGGGSDDGGASGSQDRPPSVDSGSPNGSGGGSGNGDGDNDSDGGAEAPSPEQPQPSPGDPPPSSEGGDGGSGNSGDDGSGGGDDGGSDTPAPGPLTDIRFTSPRDIAADGNGNLYLIDGPFDAARIRRIAPDGSVSTIVDTASNISELAVTPSGKIFYSTVGENTGDPSARADTIWSILNGATVEVASNDVGVVGKLAVHPISGMVYFASTGATLKKVEEDGSITTLFAFDQRGLVNAMTFRGDTLWIVRSDMPRSSDLYRWTEVSGPQEVILDTHLVFDSVVPTDSGVYVSKSNFTKWTPSGYNQCMIELLDPASQAFTFIAGGTSACEYQEGTGESARFNVINNITQGSDGNLYLTDSANHVIRRVTPAGEVTLFAGTPGESGD